MEAQLQGERINKIDKYLARNTKKKKERENTLEY